MSKNHPHDNIYSILGKLEALQPTTQEKHDAKVQQIRESVEAQGSIIKGLRDVSSVEQRLARQFAESQVNEKAVSQAQQKFMGMVHAAQKGEKAASPEVAKVAKDMGKKDAKDFASTKHKGLPKHVEEETCNECGMCESECGCDHTNEGEVTRKPGVTTHRKTDFPGYPVDDYADSETERTSKRGRPLKAQTKKPRVDPNAPKKGRGRPKADKPLGHGAPKMHDPFGRVPASASKIKGTRGSVHSMDEAMATMSQRFTRIVEGVNFRAMAEETNQTIDELMMELQQDINNYKTSGHCSDKLKDFLMVHSHAKKQMADEAVNPNNPFYKKQNDYDLPPAMRGHGTADYKLPDVKAHDNINRDDYRDRAGLDPLHNELNELARLAGIADEGNAFTGKLKDTPKGDTFDLDGKEYTDTSGLDEDPEAEFEGNAFGKAVRDAKADGIQPGEKVEVGGNEYPVKEADVSVDDAGADPVNKPKAKYYSMKASTMNPGEGDAGEKAMHANKPTFKNGDNPLSKTAVTPVKEATLSLEARLAAEYESIKKVTK